jgi:hypothetical protein
MRPITWEVPLPPLPHLKPHTLPLESLTNGTRPAAVHISAACLAATFAHSWSAFNDSFFIQASFSRPTRRRFSLAVAWWAYPSDTIWVFFFKDFVRAFLCQIVFSDSINAICPHCSAISVCVAQFPFLLPLAACILHLEKHLEQLLVHSMGLQTTATVVNCYHCHHYWTMVE